MPDLLDQIQSFIFTMAAGILLGIIIHYYQLTIRKSRINKYLLYCIDFILWIILIGIIFICLLLINMGEMRVYVLIAMMLGVLIYYHYLSRYLSQPLVFAARATINTMSLVKSIIRRPFTDLSAFIRSFRNHSEDQPPDQCS